MAIWKMNKSGVALLIAAGVFALLISPPAQASQCITLDKFVEYVSPANPSLMIAKSDARDKALNKLNENRASMGKEPIAANMLLIGIITLADKSVHVGVAMFDANGCVIEETVVFLTIEQWAGFAVAAGISVDDFAPLQGL